jgi:hypothetical protein
MVRVTGAGKKGVVTGTSEGVGEGIGFSPSNMSPVRLWGFASTAITSTMRRPLARVRISPFSTQST